MKKKQKKETTKKPNPKKSNENNKKVVRRKKKIKPKKLIGMEMEQIYSLINITQIKRIEQEIIIEPISSPMLENILKDCHMSFIKTIEADGHHYTISPPPEKEISNESFIFPEEMSDEIIGDGFCF